LIHVKDIRVTYPCGNEAVKGLSFDVDKGERVALVGANGAGKSTLLLSLMGVIELKSGEAEVAGIMLEKKSLPELRRRVGMVFQNPDDQLFMPSIYDDLAFGPRNAGLTEDEVDSRVNTPLETLNATQLTDKMPHRLSGGEKRLAALGSVLTMRPKVMLLDEPSSFLDPAARRNLIGLLNSLEMTMLIATKYLDFALEVCSRVILIKKGQEFADGKAEVILRDEALLKSCSLELPLSLSRR
jgi:cobalt/nickel transport system ATP-binding protein